MFNSGVNTSFAKCFILFMSVAMLLQGIVYSGLSLWGLTIILRNCSKEAFNLSSKPFQSVMNLIYFLNKDCGNPSVKFPGVTESTTLNVDFNKADIIETRTFILFISYAIISTLWIITSLAIIITLCRPITKTVYCVCFWPWFLIVMVGSLLDAAATGFHIHDMLNTTSVVKTFKYLGISTNDETIELLSSFNAYFITPAIIMTCISSRAILIWLLNIFGSGFCVSISRTLSKRNSLPRNNSTANITSVQQAPHQEILPIQIQHGEQHRFTEQTKPTLPLLTIQSFQAQPLVSSQSDKNSRPFNAQSPTVPSSNLQTAAAPPLNEHYENINDKNFEKYLDRVNHPQLKNISQYQHQLSPISPLNNRYSAKNEIFQYPKQNQRVSEELKGQLPWSYTSFSTPVSNEPQMQVYPEIPAPDYGR